MGGNILTAIQAIVNRSSLKVAENRAGSRAELFTE